MKDRPEVMVARSGACVISDSRVSCPRKAGGVDPESCYSCTTSCSAAQSFTGRAPDSDIALSDRIGIDAFRMLLR
jgi:hypothetical protein